MDILDLPFTAPAIARMIAAEKSGPIWIAEFEAGGKSGLFSFHPANFHSADPGRLTRAFRRKESDFILASQQRRHLAADGRARSKMERKPAWKKIWGHIRGEHNLVTFVTSACEDNDGNLIVGTLGAGVFWYEPDGNCRQISKAQGLSSDFVLSLCMDRGGNLWVGTDGDG